MTHDEIVNALRENAEWCDANEYDVPLCMGDNQRAAADLIESLQSQLADYHHMSELVDGKMEENQRLRRINENLQEQLAAERDKYAELQRYNVDCTKACDRQMVEILELREQSANLAESQRRERAAVEDARQGSVCRTCHYLNNGCEPLNLDAGCHKWQWRGPQEAGKGEAE